MAAASAIAVLSLSNLLGGVVKGLSGFGSAIINLLVWIIFASFGVDAGTLQQAVLSEAAANMVVAIPLLLTTKAWRTADWRLVVCLTIFSAAGSPLGALLLTALDPRIVELVMALVLMLVIVLHVKLLQRLQERLHLWRAHRKHLVPLREAGPCGDDTDIHTHSHKHIGRCTEGQQSGAAVLSPSTSWLAAACNGDTHDEDTKEDASSSKGAGVLDEPGLHAQECVGEHSLLISCEDGRLEKSDTQGAHHSSGELGASNESIAGGSSAFPQDPTPHKAWRSEGDIQRDPNHASYGCSAVHVGPVSTSPGKDKAATSIQTGSDATAAAEYVSQVGDGAVVDALPADGASGVSPTLTSPLGRGNTTGAWCLDKATDADRVSLLVDDTVPGIQHAGTCVSNGIRPSQFPCTQDLSLSREWRVRPNEYDSTAAGASVSSDVEKATDQVRQPYWQRPHVREGMRITAYGSVCGTMSGLMAGLTGMGGPPVMWMFDKLRVPKDTVRGTNAVTNVLQVRMVTYIAFSVFRTADLPLYAWASGAALVGVLLGSAASSKLDQVAFGRLLVALMCVCCLLMFMSAAGLAGKQQAA